VVTFQLKDNFLYVRAREEKGFCDYCLNEKVWLDFDQDHTFFFSKTMEISSKA
jgi:hypothetical protein